MNYQQNYESMVKSWATIAKEEWNDPQERDGLEDVVITDEDFEWFGKAVSAMHGKPYAGSECRRWYRAFYTMMADPNIIKEAVDYCLNTDPKDCDYFSEYKYMPVYLLSGYGVRHILAKLKEAP
jgi:hypothetical protein